MTGLEIGLFIAVVVLIMLCAVQLYFNVKHAVLLLKMTDAIEQALDLLDEKYSSISEVLEIPLFYDSPQIRQVLDDIDASRDAILAVANYVAIEEAMKPEELGE